MADVTLRTLTPGSAITTADLFLTRQGANTVDSSITGTQLKTFIVAAGPSFTALGDIQSGTIDGGQP